MTDTIREDSMGIKRILFKAKRRLMPTIDKWPIEKREKAAIDLYEMRCGYRFDLKKPETFSEKIIWYKLYYDHPDLGAIVDKYRFKEYIRSKLGDGYTLPLYGAYRSVQDLRDDWANLPKEFMLKSNLKSDGKFNYDMINRYVYFADGTNAKIVNVTDDSTAGINKTVTDEKNGKAQILKMNELYVSAYPNGGVINLTKLDILYKPTFA